MIFLGGTVFSKSKIFLISCLVFILAAGLASLAPIEILRYKMRWFGAAVFFLILTVLFWRRRPQGLASLRWLFLFIAIFFFAIWRYGISLPLNSPDKIWHYNGQTVALYGYVVNEPDIRDTHQKLEISVQAIRKFSASSGKIDCVRFNCGQNLMKVSGKILVTANLYPEYEYGRSLEMICELKQPEQFSGFAYDRYLARYNIYSVCYWPVINFAPPLPARGFGSAAPGEGINATPLIPPLSGGRVGALYAKIFAFKKAMAGLIEAGMSEPESSLARPIVFGGQKGLPREVRDNFQKVGLTHIMAVSGFNVSILAGIVMVVLLALGISRGLAFYLAVVLLAAYIILVGAPASARRAGLMGFLVLWALKLGRLHKMTNSLVLAATVLLLINPKLLRDDAGFQLSFLAMAGLVYVYPIFEAIWQKFKLPKLKGLSDALLITLAAQVFTLPALAYNFSQISLIAPLANLAALWAVPILTVAILAALPLAALLPSLSFVFFLPSLILTKYILLVVKYLARWPYSHWEIDYFSWGWVIIYYFAAIFAIVKLRRSELLKREISGKI